MKITDDFITVKIFREPLHDLLLLGFTLKVKHCNLLEKDYGAEKTQRFCERVHCKTEEEILSFIVSTIPCLIKRLERVLERGIATVYDVGDTLKDFPFTEWRIEKL